MNQNPFEGMQVAQVYETGTYLPPSGRYTLAVDRLILKDTRQSGRCFIAEFQIVASTHPNAPVGSTATWIQKMAPPEIALPAVKGFIFALTGEDLKDPNANALSPMVTQFAVSPLNPFMGWLIDCETYNKPTRAGKDFTKHDWGTTAGQIRDLAPIYAAAQTVQPPQYATPPATFPTYPGPHGFGGLPPAPPVAYVPPPPPAVRHFDPSGTLEYFGNPPTWQARRP